MTIVETSLNTVERTSAENLIDRVSAWQEDNRFYSPEPPPPPPYIHKKPILDNLSPWSDDCQLVYHWYFVIPKKQYFIPDFLQEKLYPFQIEGVKYAIAKERTFIADEMGLGKTIQALSAVETLNAYPALIVCPASLKYNWQNEIKKWLPHRTNKVVNGDAAVKALLGRFKSNTDFQIINYDKLNKFAEGLSTIAFKSVIFDESHYLKNESAKRTVYATKLSNKFDYIFLLTGTAVLNRPLELIPQLRILRRLEEFGGKIRFEREFTIGYGVYAGQVKNLDFLNQRMRSICYIRHKKEEVLKDLPQKQRTFIELDINNYDEYIQAETDTINWLKEKAVMENNLLAIAKYENSTYANTLAKIEILKQVCAKGKMPLVCERIQDFLDDSEEKLVVFANHIEIQKGILERFPDAAHIFGEDTLLQRNENVNRFQNEADCRLIVCSLQVGGLGINLTAASNVYFVELGWNPAIHDQAEDRTHRIGQLESVSITYFLGKDTIDQWIYELIEKKRVVVTATTDGGDDPEGKINMLNELVRMLKKGRK